MHKIVRSRLSIFLFAGAFLLTQNASAGLKPSPRGIYDLLPGALGNGTIDLTDNPLLDNPNVDGFRYRTAWSKIQPNSADEYLWDSIDAAIAIAAAHGKKLCISISAGFFTPDWVYSTPPLVFKYAMLEKDRDTGESLGNQPLPWDTAYQAKWLHFLQAFGARYESNPACSYVVMGGFMQVFNMVMTATSEDTAAMEAIAQNPPADYPGLTTSYLDFASAYIPAAEKIISDYKTNFPTTPLLLTLLRVIPGDTTIQNTIVDWAKETYPDQFGTMVSALYAVPPPHNPPPPPLSFPKGFQMVCVTKDVSRLYTDPDPAPLPVAPVPLEDALEHAVTLGGQYVEVYPGDLVAPEHQAVLAQERAKLIANVGEEAAPMAPINLHITP